MRKRLASSRRPRSLRIQSLLAGPSRPVVQKAAALAAIAGVFGLIGLGLWLGYRLLGLVL